MVPDKIRNFIVQIFANTLKSSEDTISRVFELAKPKITLQADLNYWRIDPENGVLLKKLLAEYA